ncbi:MAG: aldo/keto reductase [Pseudomonadota bacterium]
MTIFSRRQFLTDCLKYSAAGCASGLATELLAGESSASSGLIKRELPGSNKAICAIGMGTWRTFNIGSDKQAQLHRTNIVDLFFQSGGQMIDSSPMYGSAQRVLGHSLRQLNYPPTLFAAEKVWSSDGGATRSDIQQTASNWGINTFDLMQVHNLLSWEQHLETLQAMKANGDITYLGMTTSHGRRHRDLENIMLNNPLDFVQLTYNIFDREVEQRLLPIANEKNIAIIANRPFQGGSLIRRLKSKQTPLPDFARDIDCDNWSHFLLKFVISHPAVTFAIPATSQLEHMVENMGAARGALPDHKQRQAMIDYLQSI